MICQMYAITDLDDVTNSAFPSLPVVAIFQQSTGSNAGTIGLLMIYFFNEILTTTILLLTLGRMLWTLGRDQATPFPDFIGKVNPTWKNPWNATFVTGVLVSLIGLIYIASVEAFNAMVGSFVIFTTMSYLAAILPHLLSGRKFVVPGPFWMKGWFGMVTIGIACVYIVVFNVIYTFPFALPVYAGNMVSVVLSRVCFSLAGRSRLTTRQIELQQSDDWWCYHLLDYRILVAAHAWLHWTHCLSGRTGRSSNRPCLDWRRAGERSRAQARSGSYRWHFVEATLWLLEFDVHGCYRFRRYVLSDVLTSFKSRK